jgi:multicomponent Na+:H+ antiporter subunit G
VPDVIGWVADACIVVGSLVMTVAVAGVIRMPDIYTRIHAAAKAPVLGAGVILLASIATGDAMIIARAMLIIVLLAITTVVSAHIIGWAAYVRREPWMNGSVIRTIQEESGADEE